jgi:hypothetical protein
MSKAISVASQEMQYKARAEHYLAETQKILRQLAAERQQAAQRSKPQSSLLEQVKEILYGK